MKSTVFTILLAVAFVSPSMAADLKDKLVAMENTSWQAWGNHDVKVYTDFMAEGAVQVSTDGKPVRGRDEITALVGSHRCTLKSVDLSDVDVRQPSADTAILTYVATQDMVCAGEKAPAKVFSTVFYVSHGDEWRWIHYQETAIE